MVGGGPTRAELVSQFEIEGLRRMKERERSLGELYSATNSLVEVDGL